MPLFADDPNAWGAIMSIGGITVSGFFGWLIAKNNARTASLETKVEACEEDRSALRTLYDALVAQLKAVGVLPRNDGPGQQPPLA